MRACVGAWAMMDTDDATRLAHACARVRALEAMPLEEGEDVALLPQCWWSTCASAFEDASQSEDAVRDAVRGLEMIDMRVLMHDGDDDGDAEVCVRGTGSWATRARDGLRERVDYAIVKRETFERLVDVVGMTDGSKAIIRTSVSIAGTILVEVYGERFSIHFGELEPKTIELSRAASARELLDACRDAYGEALRDAQDSDLRVVDYYSEARGEVLTTDLTKKLDALHLVPNQALLVERKECEYWPEEQAFIALPAGDDDMANAYDADSLEIDVSLTPKNDVSTCQAAAKVGTRGKAGLSNLGNTCFMNSALQCLSHSSLLTEYFLSDKYLADINTDNPIGMGGELATEYANLTGALWRDGALTVTPRKFKSSLARFAPQFSGYSQQDAQELLAFLLDGLHEDLNRVKKKPYVEERDSHGRTDADIADESWEAHTARNNSCIVDTFQGQYRSTLVCPTCGNKSVKFDPFMYLSIPLPTSRERMIKVTLVTYGEHVSAVTYGLKVPKTGDIATLTLALCEIADIDTMDERIVMLEVYNHRIDKVFTNMNMSLSLISDRDVLYAHRLPALSDTAPTMDTVLVHRRSGSQTKSPYAQVSSVPGTVVKFGFPWIVPVSSAEGETPGAKHAEFLERTVEKYAETYMRTAPGTPHSPSTSAEPDERRASAEPDARLFKLKYTNHNASATFEEYGSEASVSDSHVSSNTLSAMHVIAIDWSSKALANTYDEDLFDVTVEHSSVKTNEISEAEQGTPLTSCIETFTQEEPLGKDDMWYCKQCETHVEALKKLDLYRLPPILVMHLKRFNYSRLWRDKISTLVDFPLANLDMTPYVLPHAPRTEAPIYDLYAVVNHFGSMGGGHYTAYTQHAEEGTWHLYDDSHCTPVDAEAALHNAAAYVLFYKRRDVPITRPMSRAGSLMNFMDADTGMGE